ncbi:probable glycosyltransferase STELLO1 [Haliotis rufescens]|uniref:probable glycosyltransferase STELLO1 n=1 Tax=Haliotis rufescens TaxID=6454 RepID=UPI00201F18EF|nr:probable glycosyltransferase STELLO1 [Haliotis rufescens]
MTQIPGWKTVVVGDGKCPQGCRFPDCVFLDREAQDYLPFSMATSLPRDNPARKNLGYLYAIQQQAEFIYDTDVNTRPLDSLTSFYYGNTSGLVYRGGQVFNYYRHYGEHWHRPQGMVDLKLPETNPNDYVLSDIPQPEVQHGLIKAKDDSGPRFQSVAPLAFVGSESVAPFNARNTMFSRRAFWGLLLFPVPNSDVIRSYILQSLLKHIQGFVGFLPPNAEEMDTLPDFKDLKIPQTFVSLLYQWQCERTTLSQCFQLLSTVLLDGGIISDEGVDMISTWMSDLLSLGYEGLSVDTAEAAKMIPKTNKLGHGEMSNTVQFSPTPGVHYSNNPASKNFECVEGLCDNFTYPPETPHQFNDVLLIITFNYAFLYDNINFVESLYRRYFPHILFCGPNIKRFRTAVTSLPANSSVAYVTGIERGWLYFQECTVYGMKMNFNVKGYLQIGEDTLLNTWNLWTLPREKIWFNKGHIGMWRHLENKWVWWSRPYGRTALNKTFTFIESKAREFGDSMEKRFYNQYIDNVHNNFRQVFHRTCDFFYIPNRLKDEFVHFTKQFFESTLLVEVAIPTMIIGLDAEENIVRVNGKVVWGSYRNKPEKSFNADTDHFLHAFKGRKQMKLPNCKKFMCEKYLPLSVERMMNS